jgi:hypothetical protein
MGIRVDKIVYIGEELCEFFVRNDIRIVWCYFLDLFPMVMNKSLASPITINNLKYILLWKRGYKLKIFNQGVEVYPSDKYLSAVDPRGCLIKNYTKTFLNNRGINFIDFLL